MDNKSFSPLAWYGPGKYANSAINADLDPVMVEIADSVFIERGQVFMNKEPHILI